MELSKYIIFNTEKEVVDFVNQLEQTVSTNSDKGMFSYRPNKDKSKWAAIIDPNFKIKPRRLTRLNSVNSKYKLKLKRGKYEKASDIFKVKFKLEDPNKLDPIEWDIYHTPPNNKRKIIKNEDIKESKKRHKGNGRENA